MGMLLSRFLVLRARRRGHHSLPEPDSSDSESSSLASISYDNETAELIPNHSSHSVNPQVPLTYSQHRPHPIQKLPQDLFLK